MTLQGLRTSMIRAALGFALTVLAATGCGQGKNNSIDPIRKGTVPQMPKPIVGAATISGTVRDAAGGTVAGATVRVAETDATVTTNAAGAYTLTIPSDSTITLATSAPGFATSYRESIMLAHTAAATGLDVMLVPVADVNRFTALAFPAETATRGL